MARARMLWQNRLTGGRGLVAVAAAISLSLALTGCLGTSYRYISHPSTNTYVRLPSRWKIYTEDEVLKSPALGLSPDQQAGVKQQIWQLGFDGDPQPSLDHLFSAAADHPAGLVRVRKLSANEADAVSVSTLRSEILGNDPMGSTTSNDSGVNVIRYEPLSRPGGYRGSRMVVKLSVPSGAQIILDQLGFIDSKGTSTYLIAFGCSPECYNANRSTIDQVFSSWTLKAR